MSVSVVKVRCVSGGEGVRSVGTRDVGRLKARRSRVEGDVGEVERTSVSRVEALWTREIVAFVRVLT